MNVAKVTVTEYKNGSISSYQTTCDQLNLKTVTATITLFLPLRKNNVAYYLEKEENDPLLRTYYLERVQCSVCEFFS